MMKLKQLLPIALTILLGACASKGGFAPVVDRTTNTKNASVEPVAPGYYRIKRGDTLLRIALDHGQSYRDVAEWNNISDPNVIEVDQVIRVAPPKGSKSAVKADKKEAIQVKKIEPDKKEKLDPQADKKAPEQPEVKPEQLSKTDVADGIRLSWPSKGEVIEKFDELKNKGIDIAGKLGDPVLAAADGKVVYAGNSLRGYGNLVIVKHDNTYLTAYAHNKSLLVKEGDMVKKSQKIAEMGNSDAERVKLHFELRKNGKPVDPSSYLP